MFENERTFASFEEKADDGRQTTLNSNNNRFLIISARKSLPLSCHPRAELQRKLQRSNEVRRLSAIIGTNASLLEIKPA